MLTVITKKILLLKSDDSPVNNVGTSACVCYENKKWYFLPRTTTTRFDKETMGYTVYPTFSILRRGRVIRFSSIFSNVTFQLGKDNFDKRPPKSNNYTHILN